MPSSSAIARGVQPARAAEGQQREAARVDAALDGHDAQRADHLGVRDADDARARPRRAPSPSDVDRALGGVDVERRRRRRAASSGSSRPSTRFASVTVGSVPPRP